MKKEVWISVAADERGWLILCPDGQAQARILLREGGLLFPVPAIAQILGISSEEAEEVQKEYRTARDGMYGGMNTMIRAACRFERRSGKAAAFLRWVSSTMNEFAVNGEAADIPRLKRHSVLREGYYDRLRERVLELDDTDTGVPRIAAYLTMAADYSPKDSGLRQYLRPLLAGKLTERETARAADVLRRYLLLCADRETAPHLAEMLRKIDS